MRRLHQPWSEIMNMSINDVNILAEMISEEIRQEEAQARKARNRSRRYG